MLYAIIDELTYEFKGFYDTEVGGLTPDDNFIEITEEQRTALLTNPKQQWSGSEWEVIPATLEELKNGKKKELEAMRIAALTFNWERGAESGSAYMSRLERMELRQVSECSGGDTFYVFGFALVIDVTNPVRDAIDEMEAYEYALDNWYRSKTNNINAAADSSALDSIDLAAGQPSVITITLPI